MIFAGVANRADRPSVWTLELLDQKQHFFGQPEPEQMQQLAVLLKTETELSLGAKHYRASWLVSQSRTCPTTFDDGLVECHLTRHGERLAFRNTCPNSCHVCYF